MYSKLSYAFLILLSFIFSLELTPIKSLVYLQQRKTSEWPCAELKIPNAVVKYRRRNKIAKIRCEFGYGIIGGDRRLTCVNNKWNGNIPHCITIGCEDVSLLNGETIQLYSGALVRFSCNPGYKLEGSPAVFCDGIRWNSTAPTCIIPQEMPHHTDCNFEFQGMCDWINDHTDDFNWKRSTGVMNAVIGTMGAKIDHTIKKSYGHYLFVDGNENWNATKKARIFSTIIAVPKETPSCVTMWYHMNGPTTGTFKVYLKPETLPFEVLFPRIVLRGDHKDQWRRITLHISDLADDWFQIVLEACGGIGFMSDIAIDDFQVLSGIDCILIDSIVEVTTKEIITESHRPIFQTTSLNPITYPWSCENRCGNPDSISYHCSCSSDCTPSAFHCCTYFIKCPNGVHCPDLPCCNNFLELCLNETHHTTTSAVRFSTAEEYTSGIPLNVTSGHIRQSEYNRSTVGATTEQSSTKVKSTSTQTSPSRRETSLFTVKIDTTTDKTRKPTSKSTSGTYSSTRPQTSSDKSSVTTSTQLPDVFTSNFSSTSRTHSSLSYPKTTQTTTNSQTEPQTLSFAGSENSPSANISAPILVAVLGLIIVSSIIAVYWVKRKHQSSLYQYSDIRCKSEKINTEERVQRDTSNYVPLGDDTLVPIDCE